MKLAQALGLTIYVTGVLLTKAYISESTPQEYWSDGSKKSMDVAPSFFGGLFWPLYWGSEGAQIVIQTLKSPHSCVSVTNSATGSTIITDPPDNRVKP